MKGIVGGQDLVFTAPMRRAVAPRQFDRCFIAFGAAVTKKNAVSERMTAKLLRQFRLRENMIEV